MSAGSRSAKGLMLLVVLALVLSSQFWLKAQQLSRFTGQSVTPTDPVHPPADPIYDEASAIARAFDELAPGCVITGSAARLTSKLNATRWLKGPMASEWGTERAESIAESTAIASNDDGLPYWVVGIKCQSITVGQALNTIGVEDNRVVEGAFFFFDASSGARTVTGALDAQTWTNFGSLTGLPGDSIPITPMTPVVLVFDSTAQPTETLSVLDLATINALETLAAATGTP